MSHSVVKDFPTQTDNTLILVVNKNGELSVDKETLDGYAKLGNSQVSILRVDNDDGSTVDMTLDTFHHTDTMEELSISVEDEIIRNYNSFRMDHCYTPLTSPSQQKPPIPSDNIDDLELDDLAHTLSILDGSEQPSEHVSIPAKTLMKVSHKTNEKEQQKVELLSGDKVTLLNKVNKLGVNKVYKSVKTVLKGAKVIKKTELSPPESDPDDDDDLNDSDYELDESPIKKHLKKPANKRRSKLDNEVHNDVRNKIVKVRKGVKHIMYKPNTPQKTIPPEPKPEPIPTTPVATEPLKSPESKKLPKKEKKVPKQIDDGIALFSTPDIIRRVGSGKPGEKIPESPESPTKVRPAKIEDRSKSESGSGRHSTESKIKLPHRHSLDSKTSHSEKTKGEMKQIERRSSTASDKSIEHHSFNSSSQNVAISDGSIGNHNESFDSLSDAVGNLENADIIRSIIHTNEPTPMDAQPVVNSVINPVDQSQLNLENAALDIDQNILDNINTDELIPEDILYQVAKLVENPDVQNVLDRTLVDASLNLEPSIQASIADQQPVTVPQAQIVAPTSVNQSIHPSVSPHTQPIASKTAPKPIQIVRSDGRVVTLPPIEKPATRSSKKKQEVQVQPPVHQPPPQPLQPQQPVIQSPSQPIQKVQHVPKVQKTFALPLSEEFIVDDAAAAEAMESDSDESWNSEDDPDRLWCICKQPHNNRFMICCDTCEDWFHGKCVNVTKAMGQLMEQQGREWQCPNCVKKNSAVTSTSSVPNTGIPKPAKVATDTIKRKSIESGPSCIVCGSLSRANSVYCSDACILKHAQGVEKETSKAQKSSTQRIIVFERSTGKCLSGPNAPTASNLKQWLREHPGFEVVRPVNKPKQNQNLVQSKLQLIKNPQGKDGVGLAVHRKGVQVGVLPHASKQQNTIKLIPATKMNVPGTKPQVTKPPVNPQTTPNKKLVQSTLKSPTPTTSNSTATTATTPQEKPKVTTPTNKLKVARERKQKLHPQHSDNPKQNGQENIRETVKRTLNEQLITRLKEVDDIKLSEEEVDKMATEIETQLYKLFGDSGPKYRAKYRSLIFNIKDTKNQTLWRRICEKSISPHQLVRLSPEEMASQELARWRERENKHQLDMIKKSELEMLSINRTYVLKTHKGEQVMEDRPAVKVDSTEIIPGLGADSTSEHDANADKGEKSSDHSSDHSSERRSSSKHSRRDRDRDKRSSKERTRNRSGSKDRKSNKDHKSSRSKRSRSRERDKERDRNTHKNERRRSRSRERHHRSSHKSSRHKRDKHSTEHLDKKSREILDNLENNKIVPPPEDRLWKHVPQQDIQEVTPGSDSDHEPTSTVTIPTPPRSTDQEDLQATKKDEPIVSTAVAAKIEPKIDATKSRIDPRLNRDTSSETPPKSESPQPPTTPTLSTSPVPTLSSKYTSESKETKIWEGNITMVDVAKFFIGLHEVSGDCTGLGNELPSTLEIVGRISPATVWDYIGKMRRSNSKIISVLRLIARNLEEQIQYIALYSYLSSKTRFGVIKSTTSAVKDFYIMPLASHAPVPQALLPLSGPGFEESRPHLLLGIVVRAKRKRPNPMDIVTTVPIAKRTKIEDSAIISQPSTTVTPAQPPRSYTPPPTRDPRIRLPTVPTVTPIANDDDEPYSPEDSDPETTAPTIIRKPIVKPTVTTAASAVAAAASSLNLKTGDIASVLSATLKTSTFLETPAAPVSFEPFANKFDGIPGLDVDTSVDSVSIAQKIEELNKCIEQQKEEINSMSQNLVSSGAAASMASNLSNISLPSNLQQILDSIKNIPSTNTGSQDTPEEYCPSTPGYKTASGGADELTIPLMLPKLSSRTQTAPARPSPSQLPLPPEPSSTIPLQLPVPAREPPPPQITTEGLQLPNLSVPPPGVSLPIQPVQNTLVPPPVVLPNMTIPPPLGNIISSNTIPLNLPKTKTKISNIIPPTPPAPTLQPPGTTPVIIPPSDSSKTDNKPSSVLSSLSEEELIRKAAEMLGEAEPEKEDSPGPETNPVSENKNYQTSQSVKSAPVMYTTPPVAPNPSKRTKIDPSQPPVPGLEDEFES